MAVYNQSLTVPQNTPEAYPVEVVLTPLNGLLRSCEILYPPGAANTVGIRILDEGRQIAPVTGGWFYGNGERIAWIENRRLQGPPYRVIMQGFSTAIDWPHTVLFRMEVY